MALGKQPTEEKELTIKDYVKDIFEIKGELTAIKRHMDERKAERIEDSKVLADIKNTLIGSNMNGNKGIIYLLNDIDFRLKAVEKAESKRATTENNAKWIGGFAITAILALMVWIIQHLPKLP